MDPLQEQLTRIGLQVVGRRGFVLGGGHAIELHGMGTRPSEDIDLFSAERGSPGAVADDLIAAYHAEGLGVHVSLRTPDLVQMEVTGTGGEGCKVDLGVFWRAHAPGSAGDRAGAASRRRGRGEDGRAVQPVGAAELPGRRCDPGQRPVLPEIRGSTPASGATGTCPSAVRCASAVTCGRG